MKYVEKILETYGLPVQKIEQMYADLYTDNKHVPEDVPFDVIADEFIQLSARKPIGQLCCRWEELPLHN